MGPPPQQNLPVEIQSGLGMGGIGLMELEGTSESLVVRTPCFREMDTQSGEATCLKSHSKLGAEWLEA